MTSSAEAQSRGHAASLQRALDSIEYDPSHHLAGPFLPQTPLESHSPVSNGCPPRRKSKLSPAVDLRYLVQTQGLWTDIITMQWMRVPSSSLKILLIPVILYVNWTLVAPNVPNPFAPLLLVSGKIHDSPPDDPRYAKTYLDLVFLAYHIIVFSFIRQFISLVLSRRIAKHFGIRKEGKLDRFGEQAYAVVYFSVMGLWGVRIMLQQPTWWYRTEYFWIDYPHWAMKPELKRYYLMQASYWCQQLLVLLLGMEKPRKDYAELVAHHFVTLWLIGWSYLINMTLIGNAVYISMDLPDAFLGVSKLLNYLQMETSKSIAFGVFLCVWTYFRHWLNLVMLQSVWTEFDLMPEISKRWYTPDGVWMVWWMKYQVFAPLLLLQILNLFWYFFIWRIAIRAIFGSKIDDDRSDDEGDEDNMKHKKDD